MNNMERLPADTFFLDLELRQEVERMASLGYGSGRYRLLSGAGCGDLCL